MLEIDKYTEVMKYIETPTAVQAEQTPKEPTGILGALRSVFHKRAHRQVGQPESSLHFTEEQLLEFWLNKYTMIQSLPSIAITAFERQAAMEIVSQFLRDETGCDRGSLVQEFKKILLDLPCSQFILNQPENFFTKIPIEVFSDRLFILNLRKNNPDLMLRWSIAIFKEFTPVKLFDPSTSSLKNEWACIEHLRDHKVGLIKRGMFRKDLDILDIWLLNIDTLTQGTPTALDISAVVDRFSRLRSSEDLVVLPPDPDMHTSPHISPAHTARSARAPEADRRQDTQPEAQDNSKKIIWLSQNIIGRKFSFYHPEHGDLDVILTNISQQHLEFIVYAGKLIGCPTKVPIHSVSSCLIEGDQDSRILNTNIIRVKT